MSFELKFNSKTKTFDILIDDKLVKTLNESQSIDMFDDMKKILNDYEYTSNPLWSKMSIEDIELDLCPVTDIKGISFEMYWYYEDTHFCRDSYIRVMKNEEPRNSETLDNIDFHHNFSDEKFLAGSFTNHELRSCIGDDLLGYIKSNPNFKIYFNLKEINRNYFFDEEKTYYFKAQNEYYYR